MEREFRKNIEAVRSKIEDAASRAGRDPSEIKLIAVTKTHSVEVISEAVAAGLNLFGENKVQEAIGKIPAIGYEGIEWHLIGHLQKNKARKAVLNFDVIHSVDSVSLANRLNRICGEEGIFGYRVLIQVDLAGEATKSGVSPDEIERTAAAVLESGNLRLTGLMAIPPHFTDAELVRPYFRQLREIGERLVASGVFPGGKCELSMGMTNDFEIAIEEGATMIRVGTALFGARG